jgi:zinc protease
MPLFMRQSGAFFALLAFLLTAAPAQATLFNPKSMVLPNGLLVVVIENRRAPIVGHMLWVKAGSADDPYGKSGLAHYLEHLMFKGTKKFPEGEYSRRIARVGGIENAFTTADHTAYHALVAKEHLPMLMELEADRFANLIIDEKSAKPELQVVLDERRQRVDSDPFAPFSHAVAAMTFPHHPYGTPVIGWQEEIESFTASDARQFFRTWYNPANAVVIITGDIGADEVFELARRYYGVLPKGTPIARTRVKSPNFPVQQHITMTAPQVHQKLVEYVFRAPSYRTNGTMAYALDVLQEVLDGSEAAFLPRTLIKEKKLASHVDISYPSESYDETSFTITLVPEAGQSDEAVLNGLKEVLKDAAKMLTPEELASAKQSMQRASVFARDSLMSPAHIFGIGLCGGRSLEEVDSWPERINAVTLEELKKAHEFVLAASAITGSVGPDGTPAAPPVPAVPPVPANPQEGVR